MFYRTLAFSLAALLLIWISPLPAQTDSEAERLERLERAVEKLQKRNAELEDEVRSLKRKVASAPEVDANGNKKPASDGKTLLEKPVATEEKPPVFVVQRGPEIKLTLGGFIQANFEDGDVSAFEGRFGLSALKDRFRLRRARINMTGEFAEQFDFKMEGDFEQSDFAITALKSVDVKTGKITTVSNSTRTGFSATDIFINWHAIP